MQRIEAILDFIDTLPGFYDLSPYQRRLVLLERYLSLYLDFEPKDGAGFGQLLSTMPAEDYRTMARYKFRIDQYEANEIKDAFGYTLDEFLALPTFFMEELLDRRRKVLRERREANEKARREALRNNGLDLPDLGRSMHNFRP